MMEVSNGVKKIAIYPGSFDPVTFGHIDLIRRACNMFDQVIIAVAHTSQKSLLFSTDERVAMLKQATKNISGIHIEPFGGLLVTYAKSKKAKVMIRGLRMISDFEYEFQMALTNKRLAPSIETIYVMPQEAFCYFSSKLIKEVAALGGNLKYFVPAFVEKKLKAKFRKKRR